MKAQALIDRWKRIRETELRRMEEAVRKAEGKYVEFLEQAAQHGRRVEAYDWVLSGFDEDFCKDVDQTMKDVRQGLIEAVCNPYRHSTESSIEVNRKCLLDISRYWEDQ